MEFEIDQFKKVIRAVKLWQSDAIPAGGILTTHNPDATYMIVANGCSEPHNSDGTEPRAAALRLIEKHQSAWVIYAHDVWANDDKSGHQTKPGSQPPTGLTRCFFLRWGPAASARAASPD